MKACHRRIDCTASTFSLCKACRQTVMYCTVQAKLGFSCQPAVAGRPASCRPNIAGPQTPTSTVRQKDKQRPFQIQTAVLRQEYIFNRVTYSCHSDAAFNLCLRCRWIAALDCFMCFNFLQKILNFTSCLCTLTCTRAAIYIEMFKTLQMGTI